MPNLWCDVCSKYHFERSDFFRMWKKSYKWPKSLGIQRFNFSHVLKKDLQKTITWNDIFLQHMRKINLTYAQSLMSYLRKTWTWNNIFFPYMRKVNIYKTSFHLLKKNDFSNKYLLQISCHRLLTDKIRFSHVLKQYDLSN